MRRPSTDVLHSALTDHRSATRTESTEQLEQPRQATRRTSDVGVACLHWCGAVPAAQQCPPGGRKRSSGDLMKSCHGCRRHFSTDRALHGQRRTLCHYAPDRVSQAFAQDFTQSLVHSERNRVTQWVRDPLAYRLGYLIGGESS